mgnify:CR=1 FL=1
MKLEDLQVYQISMKLADEVHDLILEWDNFHKYSTGTQLLDAATQFQLTLVRVTVGFILRTTKISFIFQEVLFLKQKHG